MVNQKSPLQLCQTPNLITKWWQICFVLISVLLLGKTIAIPTPTPSQFFCHHDYPSATQGDFVVVQTAPEESIRVVISVINVLHEWLPTYPLLLTLPCPPHFATLESV